MDNSDDYLTWIQIVSDNFESLILAPESEIFMSTVDVPLFNLFAFKELTLFKLFSWVKTVYHYAAEYETFVQGIENIQAINNMHEKIAKNYPLVASTEIWTANTIDAILRLIGYHSEMKHFRDEKFPLLLCEQLLELLNTLQKWAEKGIKGSKEMPFRFYVSEMDVANTFVLFKTPKNSNCMVRLYTINGLSISDERFCEETEKWIRSAAQRSMLISGASEKARFKFFESQKQKIRYLMDSLI